MSPASTGANPTATLRHFLEVDDLSPAELVGVLGATNELAAGGASGEATLGGAGVALVFEKSSNRTRNSMELAVARLGGHPVYIRPEEVGIDTRESAEDVVRTLACFHQLVAVRVFDHSHLERMAACQVAPVINLLSDTGHPMQALADLATIGQCAAEGRFESRGTGEPIKVAYIGDANNVWFSLALGAAMLGIDTSLGAPDGYRPSEAALERIAAAGLSTAGLSSEVLVTADPAEAAADADVVYTDVWTSMGQESESAQRQKDFAEFRVDAELMSQAKPQAIFMHCLPAHRDLEVSAEVIDGPQSAVWRQAENRMHSAQALMAFLLSANAGLTGAVL